MSRRFNEVDNMGVVWWRIAFISLICEFIFPADRGDLPCRFVVLQSAFTRSSLNARSYSLTSRILPSKYPCGPKPIRSGASDDISSDGPSLVALATCAPSTKNCSSFPRARPPRVSSRLPDLDRHSRRNRFGMRTPCLASRRPAADRSMCDSKSPCLQTAFLDTPLGSKPSTSLALLLRRNRRAPAGNPADRTAGEPTTIRLARRSERAQPGESCRRRGCRCTRRVQLPRWRHPS